VKFSLAILVAIATACLLFRRNREGHILSRILHSGTYALACRLHREALARFTDEQISAGHPDTPPAPVHEATGDMIKLNMVVETISSTGAIELRCYDRRDRLTYWAGYVSLPADSTTELSKYQRVEVSGVVSHVDRQMGSIKLMPAAVGADPVGHIRLTQI